MANLAVREVRAKDKPQQMTKSELLAMIKKATDANLFSAVDSLSDEVRTRAAVQRESRRFLC
jgi:hypothetical protein